KDAHALVNADDRRGAVMVQNTRATIHSYSMRNIAGFTAKILTSTLQGMQLLVNGKDLWTRLIGAFNVSNLLAVYGTAMILGEDEDMVLTELTGLLPPSDLFEVVYYKYRDLMVIVHYAPTPDALYNVLSKFT